MLQNQQRRVASESKTTLLSNSIFRRNMTGSDIMVNINRLSETDLCYCRMHEKYYKFKSNLKYKFMNKKQKTEAFAKNDKIITLFSIFALLYIY